MKLIPSKDLVFNSFWEIVMYVFFSFVGHGKKFLGEDDLENDLLCRAKITATYYCHL